VEELERDRDALLESYAGMVSQGLDAFADADGSLSATWALTRDVSVILQNARQDEGNAYLRLGEALGRIGCEDEARAAYKAGVTSARSLATRGWLKISSLP
jgi:hypothetical protein